MGNNSSAGTKPQIPQRLLGEALLRSADKATSKTAIIAGGEEFSYEYLKTNSLNLARYLISSRISKGDRVAVFMNNSIQCAVALYGITLAGGVFIMINPQTKADKLTYLLNDSGTKIIISESLLKGVVSDAVKNAGTIIEVIISGLPEDFDTGLNIRVSDMDKLLSTDLTDVTLPDIIPLDLAALIYTSGSTGFPKGVMMTHQSMVFASWSLVQYLRLTERDRIMLVLPLSFDYGLYQLLMSVTVGSTLIIEHSFIFPASIYKSIEKWKPTVFPGVPTIFAMIIESHKKTGIVFDTIEKITNTAAALLPEMIPVLKKTFPNALIFKMYGLTECKRVCYLEPELIDEKIASVGKAIPGTELFLLDHEGNVVPPGGTGILHVRGPHVMSGYWNKPELTEEMLRSFTIPGERVLCTHDLFRMDEDGFLYFLGRTDDIIKTRGEKVSPVEVENVLLKIEGVSEAAVIGGPHEIMGEAIIAFLTISENICHEEAYIRQECARYLELFMVPEWVIIIDKMPKSANGKIDKRSLKEKLLKNE